MNFFKECVYVYTYVFIVYMYGDMCLYVHTCLYINKTEQEY